MQLGIQNDFSAEEKSLQGGLRRLRARTCESGILWLMEDSSQMSLFCTGNGAQSHLAEHWEKSSWFVFSTVNQSFFFSGKLMFVPAIPLKWFVSRELDVHVCCFFLILTIAQEAIEYMFTASAAVQNQKIKLFRFQIFTELVFYFEVWKHFQKEAYWIIFMLQNWRLLISSWTQTNKSLTLALHLLLRNK